MTNTTNLKDHDLLIKVDTKVTELALNLEKLGKGLSDFSSTLASKEELANTARLVQERLDKVEEDVKYLKGPRRIVDAILTSTFAGVALFLILFYLGHIK